MNPQTQDYFEAVVDLDDQLGEIILEGIQLHEKTSEDYDQWITQIEKILTKLSFLDGCEAHKGVLELGKILKANLDADYKRLLLDRDIHKEKAHFDDNHGSFLMNMFIAFTDNKSALKAQDRASASISKKIDKSNQLNRQRNDLSDRFNARRDAIRETFDT